MRPCLFVFVAAAPFLAAQTATLTGRISDQTNAIVPGAAVVAVGPGGAHSARAGSDGAYSIANLAPGAYKVTASAPQLATAQPASIALRQGPNVLNLQLRLATANQQLTVSDNPGPSVSVETANNASATIIKGADLEALSDDPEDLAADLQALAGPSAGPSGGAIFVDGFSGGQLPPKESIREIRINSNPFSPEYDKLGYGRIEIFTKPGSDKFHGSVGYNLGTDFWNSRNPYAARKAPFLLQETENSFSGPLTKHSSFTLDFERQAVDNGSVTNAVILDPVTLMPEAFSSVLKTPQRHWLVGPHVDYQIDENNTFSIRYLYTRGDIRDGGIGSFDLISRGEQILNTFHTVQAVETSIHGNLVNEIRFQYFRQANDTTANNDAPVIQVLGSFTGGGATLGHGVDVQNNYEFQNYTSVVRGKHFLRFGARLRDQTDDNISPSNFNGTFTFSGSPGVSSIEQYRLGTPSQFSISGGNPEISANQFDLGVFFGDDWRVRQNLTVNLGLRYEAQTNIRDRRDFAPRVAFAWAPIPKTVIRGGAGIFYDRFALANTLTADRFNGIVQQQYVVTDPAFYPAIPSLASLAANRGIQTVQEVDAHLRAPYIIQSAATLERQLPKNSTLALTYTNSHGLHILRSEDIDPGIGKNPVFLMTSSGLYNQNQFIANVNTKVNPAVSLFGYYVLNHAMSNSDGLGTFPANPYNYAGEYGPAATDVRHRVLFGGTVNLRWNIRLNPLFTAQTGAPFNITTGQDPYGTTIFNARPGLRPGGQFDPNPTPGEAIVPRNYGRGPGMITLNLRVGKTWGFGPEKGTGGGAVRSSRESGPAAGPALSAPQGSRGLFTQPSTARKYNLTVSMSGRNILNHTNQGPIIGNLTSPLFGRSNQVAGSPNGEGFSENASNRRLELQIRFTY
ncbi:MAG TPA: carboxypeptidase regulatory-like domain-containing protein [Bryobacteraceae bacterium]|nr:carboxypeptidase regulatory-like domain-containing protein [Bryobacteraceae bacterium]